MNKTNLILALGAGLMGGALSHYVLSPLPVQAQAPPPQVIRAQSFLLVDQAGEVAGRFAVDPSGTPSITLLDHGTVIWSAGKTMLRPLGSQ